MIRVQEIQTYKFRMKTFSSLKGVKTEVENRLGKIIDSMDVTLTPKQRLNILRGLVKHKEDLQHLLNVVFESTTADTFLDYDVNILDL